MVMYWVIRSAAFLSRVLPLRLRYALGAAICDLAYLAWGVKRRNAVRNAQTVLSCPPRQAARIARASWRNYGLYLIDFLRLPAISRRDIVDAVRVTGWEHLDTALAAGRGAVFVTGHYGCWDFAPTVIDDRYPGRVYVAAETFHPRRLNDLVQGHRLAKGAQVLAAENGARRMVRALRQNGVLALVIDRPVHGAADGQPGGASGVPVTFFGRPTMVPAGAATLALLTGAPLLPGYLRRLYGGRYEARIGDPLPATATGDRAADIQRLTQQAMTALEGMIRERPAQWYMFRPFWPEPCREATAQSRVMNTQWPMFRPFWPEPSPRVGRAPAFAADTARLTSFMYHARRLARWRGAVEAAGLRQGLRRALCAAPSPSLPEAES